MNLYNIKFNEEVIILTIDETIGERIYDLGITPGTKIKCVLESSNKDLKAYLFKGTVIALRKEISSKIKVEKQ